MPGPALVQTVLWQFVVYAVVIYRRVAAEHLAGPVAEIARWVAARHGLELRRYPVVVTGQAGEGPSEGIDLIVLRRPA